MTVGAVLDVAAARTAVEAFHVEEAALLDAGDLAAWMQLVTDDFRYQVPVPVADAATPALRHHPTTFLVHETRDSLRLWRDRLDGTNRRDAWAENGRMRTRHFVTNLRVELTDDRIRAWTNVLLTWSSQTGSTWAAAGRADELVAGAGGRTGLLLRHRTVELDAPVVDLPHLRVIF